MDENTVTRRAAILRDCGVHNSKTIQDYSISFGHSHLDILIQLWCDFCEDILRNKKVVIDESSISNVNIQNAKMRQVAVT